MVLTCTGASGAPITPSNNLRSDRLYAFEEATDGVLERCPFIHCPNPPRFESPTSPPSGSGPSINGVSVSPTILMLPDLTDNGSGFTTWFCCFLRRSRRDIGDPLRAGLFARDLAGDSPRTTSSFKAEKNPCFFSIFEALARLQK